MDSTIAGSNDMDSTIAGSVNEQYNSRVNE